MASSEAANALSIKEVTSEEKEISPTDKEASSPNEQNYDEKEGALLADEENTNVFDDEDEKTEELSPINNEPEPNDPFEGSGFTEFNEEDGEEKDADDEDED